MYAVMRRLLQILTLESAPYLVTILFAAAGWSVARLVDRATTWPIIKAETSFETVGNSKQMRVKIKNISRTSKFQDLSFIFFLPADAKGHFQDAGIVALPPAFEGPEKASRNPKSVSFPISAFHPGWEEVMSTGV